MRTSTSKYLANEGGSLPQGTWTKDENILMLVLMKLCNLIELTDDDLPILYRRYHQFNQKQTNKLIIRDKTIASVNAKVKHIRGHEVFG